MTTKRDEMVAASAEVDTLIDLIAKLSGAHAVAVVRFQSATRAYLKEEKQG